MAATSPLSILADTPPWAKPDDSIYRRGWSLSPSHLRRWYDSPGSKKARQARRKIGKHNEVSTRSSLIANASKERPIHSTDDIDETLLPKDEMRESPCVVLSCDKKKSMFVSHRPIRQCVIGRGTMHESEKSFTWRVQIDSDMRSLHEVFVGITEACDFHHRGRTFGVNVFAKTMFGTNPMNPGRQDRGVKTDDIKITANTLILIKVNHAKRVVTFKAISKNETLWSFSKGYKSWKRVRFWASMKYMGDAITLL